MKTEFCILVQDANGSGDWRKYIHSPVTPRAEMLADALRKAIAENPGAAFDIGVRCADDFCRMAGGVQFVLGMA